MNYRLLLLIVVVLVAPGLACSLNLNLPSLGTGPTETIAVDEPRSAGDTVAQVTITMGAGNLDIGSGAAGLMEGTIQYNVTDWKPTITRSGDNLTLEQKPAKDLRGLPGEGIVNDWNLRLGVVPLDLTIQAGAYKGLLNLGGLRLHSLHVTDGASQARVTFDTPNLAEMDQLTYETGASDVSLAGLGRANFSQMEFKSGVGTYQLDFSGSLQRPGTVSIKTGASNLRLTLPGTTAATINLAGGLNNVNTEGTWTIHGATYETLGQGNRLTINLEMGLGNLTLVSQ
jgi:hypothetical protein